MDGRKINRSMENPFDNIFIDIAHWINTNIFIHLGFTPNIITSLSLFIGLLAAYLLYQNYYFASAIVFVIAYILDCADGNFARYYNMVTVFGDYYDHYGDILKHIAMFMVIAKHNIEIKSKITFIIFIMILFVTTLIHLGCQEIVYNSSGKQDTLSSTKKLCAKKDWIYITRFFGCGTAIVFTAIGIVAIGYFPINDLKS